jgi:hypothetical protein
MYMETAKKTLVAALNYIKGTVPLGYKDLEVKSVKSLWLGHAALDIKKL